MNDPNQTVNEPGRELPAADLPAPRHLAGRYHAFRSGMVALVIAVAAFTGITIWDRVEEKQKANRNRATLAVARKMVAYFACRGSPGTGVCTCTRPRYSGLKLRRKRLRDYTARRLPGPAVCRLSEGDQTPEAPFELFRDWQRTQTQSSVTALRGPRQ